MFRGKDSRLRKRKRLPGGRIKKPIFVYIYIFLNNMGFLTLFQRQAKTTKRTKFIMLFYLF